MRSKGPCLRTASYSSYQRGCAVKVVLKAHFASPQCCMAAILALLAFRWAQTDSRSKSMHMHAGKQAGRRTASAVTTSLMTPCNSVARSCSATCRVPSSCASCIHTLELACPLGCAADTIAGTGTALKPPLAKLTPCLLYTSPSPRDRQKSRMPSSA